MAILYNRKTNKPTSSDVFLANYTTSSEIIFIIKK